MKSHPKISRVVVGSLIVIATALNTIAGTGLAQATDSPGTLDSTFGTSGITTTAIGASYSYPNALAIDAQGRIVVGGSSNDGSHDDETIARYTSTGVLDSSFGVGGIETSTVGTGNSPVQALAIDSTGRIVVGLRTAHSFGIFVLARYTSSGILDTSFGNGGYETSTAGASDGGITGLVIDSSGRIYAAGTLNVGAPNMEATVARYTSNGQLDSTFGTNGIVSSALGVDDTFLDSIALDSSGKIYVSGKFKDGTQAQQKGMVVRYTATGALDTTFGNSGIATASLPTGFSEFTSIALDSTGRIVAAGSSQPVSRGITTIARFTSSGAADSSFGTGGVVTAPIGVSDYFGETVAIDQSGRIIVGASINDGSRYNLNVLRYTPDGTLDSSFATGGVKTVQIGPSSSLSMGTAIDSAGNIVSLAYSNIGSRIVFTLARFIGSIPTPAPAPAPEPHQQSQISASPTITEPAGSSSPLLIGGNFVEKIAAIQINGVNLPADEWVQTASGVSLALSHLPAGVYSIQIFDGSVPLLAPEILTIKATQVVPPTPTPTATVKPKVIYIHCLKPGHSLRIAYGVNPVCPVGYSRG